MQKLMKAAKEGTKDGLERTKAAVKRGRSFIRTKSFISLGPGMFGLDGSRSWAPVGGYGKGRDHIGAAGVKPSQDAGSLLSPQRDWS